MKLPRTPSGATGVRRVHLSHARGAAPQSVGTTTQQAVTVQTNEDEELEALRRENELLRQKVQRIGAKVPELVSIGDAVQDAVAAAPAPEAFSSSAAATTISVEPSSRGNGDGNGNGNASDLASSTPHSPEVESSATVVEPRSTEDAREQPAKPVQTREARQGLYEAPHSTFPIALPSEEVDPVGPSASFLQHAGVLTRIPNSWRSVQEEMEELELKNPSESLQALRETVKQLSSDETSAGQKRLRFNHSTLGSMLHNLVFVSAEAAPYSKTGGLGDVVGSLSVALAERGHRVMVVCPRYITTERDRQLMSRMHDCESWVRVDLGNGEHWVNFHHEARSGVDWVFVEHVAFERSGGLYSNNEGVYADNLFRFALLSQAACEAALQLQLPQYASVHEHWKYLQNKHEKVVAPGQYPDIVGQGKCAAYGQEVTFIANDWHAGLVPLYLNHKYKANGVFPEARSLIAIHNLAHQGTALAPEFPLFNLPQAAYQEMEWIYEEPDGRRTPVVNIMKGALLAADGIVTVSETYAWEIMRPEHGVGLHSILLSQRHRLVGILNGMDTLTWDPVSDPHLPDNYSPEDLSGKARCKAELRRKVGLPEPEYGVDVPLLGFVGRLDPQKGPDIIIEALSGLLALDCQVVMLGTGHPHLERQMKAAEADHPDFFRGLVEFSEPLAHQIMAAADILIMPSRFEPCGLNQMHAMRYGTVPVAHCTGGLVDTVLDVTPFPKGTSAHGTGWTFSPASDTALIGAVKEAAHVFKHDQERWQNIQLAGMLSDWGWGRAAQSYESVIRSVIAPASNGAAVER